MSSLLPKSSVQEFQLKDYWDKFFTKRSSAFEWYGEYIDLCHIFHKYLKPSSHILMAGCGNSRLSEDLYDHGFRNIDNIDISDVVIRQMQSKNATKRDDMIFTKMDILQMSFADSAFECVLDKGTLDAIFSNTDVKTVQKVERMFAEVARVLKTAGRYICVTLAQIHILEKLLLHFQSGWLVRVHKVKLAAEEATLGAALPVFVFVLTKMVQREGAPAMKVLEYVGDDGKCVRCEGVEQVKEFVVGSQQYAMIEHHLGKLHPGETVVQLDLWSPSPSEFPRYSLAVVDQAKKSAKNGPFAIFIVPQGREVDWLFSSDAGRLQLAESAGFERLVVVTMHRGHTYSNLEAVKEEVSAKAAELAQPGLSAMRKHPVLSLGEGLGSRVVLYKGHSDFSGSYVVEECESEGEGRVRRLVFLNNPRLAQTEVKIVSARNKKSKKKNSASSLSYTQIDHSALSSGYYDAILASLVFVPSMFDEGCKGQELCNINMLLIGLGGGALPVYITKYFHNISLDVVEIDPEMVKVAKKWFGCSEGERLSIFVADGIEFVRTSCQESNRIGSYDVILLDVDSKDTSTGMNCPPQQFLEDGFLGNMKLLLKHTGVFMTNLNARNEELKTEALKSLHRHFPSLLCISVPEDVNQVVSGLPNSQLRPDIVGGGTKTKGKCDSEIAATVGGKVTEVVERRVQLLAKQVQSCSSGVIRAAELQSKLIGFFSLLSYYE